MRFPPLSMRYARFPYRHALFCFNVLMKPVSEPFPLSYAIPCAMSRDSGWRSVTVPHDWSVEQPFSERYSSGTGYLAGGTGWYRVH